MVISKIVLYQKEVGLVSAECLFNMTNYTFSFTSAKPFLIVAVYDPFNGDYIGSLDLLRSRYTYDSDLVAFPVLNDSEAFLFSGIYDSPEDLKNAEYRAAGLCHFSIGFAGGLVSPATFASDVNTGVFMPSSLMKNIVPHRLSWDVDSGELAVYERKGYSELYGADMDNDELYFSETDGTRLGGESTQSSLRASDSDLFSGTNCMLVDGISKVAYTVSSGVDYAARAFGDFVGLTTMLDAVGFVAWDSRQFNQGLSFSVRPGNGDIHLLHDDKAILVFSAVDYQANYDIVIQDLA